MITIQNYFNEIKNVNFDSLPKELKESHDFLIKATSNGASWENYHSLKETKESIDLYLEILNQMHVPKKSTVTRNVKPTPKKVSPRLQINKISPKAKTNSIVPTPKIKRERISRKTPLKVVKRFSKPVERISDELRFIKRYLLLHDKTKTVHQIRLFINAIQRAITEKKIRKTSDFASDILEIQDALILLHSKFRGNEQIKVSLSEPKRVYYSSLVGKQNVMLSVKFLKRYINLQGKVISNDSAKNLHNQIGKSVNNNSITTKDPYFLEVKSMLENLKVFVQKNQKEGVLHIPPRELNGLNGILKSKKSLSGFDAVPDNKIVNSLDVLKMRFDKLSFKGKWLDLIGNPSRGFKAMVSGKPKMGKSILCVEFAGYLARNHGRVLYIAKEEGIGDTVQMKLKSTNVSHPNLDVVGSIPSNLNDYDFVFLDSVTKLRLSPEHLEMLYKKYPQISFIFIFQVTKEGVFRGSNDFQHDVDIVIEVYDKGKARQFGRFNQGGEIQFF